MWSLSEEDDQFFDTKESITPICYSGSDEPEISDSESRVVEDVIRNFGYEFWIRSPRTVRERHQKLLKLMSLAPSQAAGDDAEGSLECHEEILDSGRVMEHSGAVLRSSFGDLQQSSHSFISCCSSNSQELLDEELKGNLVHRIRNLDDGSEFIVDEVGQDGLLRSLREVGSNRLVSGKEFERILGLSPLVQRVMRKDADYGQAFHGQVGKHRVKKRWLQRLGELTSLCSGSGESVTCIQFNPADENYFISGSVDGKVHIWGIPRREVVDWTDVREIVTAICYRPDGKGAIVGSINGDCYFYDTSDNHLEMTDQTSLHGKKKTLVRRITGFQFCPGDLSKLMVTIADSEVRILKGVDVICRYKGFRNAGSQISASFTSDGKHIISASEDSCVYVWDGDNTERPTCSRVRTNWSCESFFSNGASIAVSWCKTTLANMLPSLANTSSARNPGIIVRYPSKNGIKHHRTPLVSSDGISWPEGKLASSNSLIVSSSTCKSEYKLLKTACQNMVGTPHAWGLVIVTAGWDGQIRVFQNYGLPVHL